MALPHVAAARGAGFGDLERHGARYRGRGNLADRVLRSGGGTAVLADRQSLSGYNGDQRGGDNLYTNCVVALDAKTGKLRWHFQFTPHDLHDWDATEPLVLVNAPFQGRERKLLLQANRSGFFYVLDRMTGEFLAGTPFVRKLTWASGIGRDGRPQEVEGNKPTPAGTKTCPAVRGATNWYSTAYNPATRLFYVMAVEDCNIYRQSDRAGMCLRETLRIHRKNICGRSRWRPGGLPGRFRKWARRKVITPEFFRRRAGWFSTARRAAVLPRWTRNRDRRCGTSIPAGNGGRRL